MLVLSCVLCAYVYYVQLMHTVFYLFVMCVYLPLWNLGKCLMVRCNEGVFGCGNSVQTHKVSVCIYCTEESVMAIYCAEKTAAADVA